MVWMGSRMCVVTNHVLLPENCCKRHRCSLLNYYRCTSCSLSELYTGSLQCFSNNTIFAYCLTNFFYLQLPQTWTLPVIQKTSLLWCRKEIYNLQIDEAVWIKIGFHFFYTSISIHILRMMLVDNTSSCLIVYKMLPVYCLFIFYTCSHSPNIVQRDRLRPFL